MKNVFLLPTDKPSRLYHHGISELSFTKKNCIWEEGRHLYITCDEDIEEGDWFMYTKGGQCEMTSRVDSNIDVLNNLREHGQLYKIVLTTDSELIDDEVQEVSDEILQWIIENPSCEEVEVFYGLFSPMGRQVDPSDLSQNQSACTWKYKVELAQGYICPQTKKQCDDECCVSAEDCHIEAGIGVIFDCEPEQDVHENLDNGQSKRRIYSRSEMIEFGKKCAEFGYENELDNEGQLTDEWINENL